MRIRNRTLRQIARNEAEHGEVLAYLINGEQGPPPRAAARPYRSARTVRGVTLVPGRAGCLEPDPPGGAQRGDAEAEAGG